MNEEPYVPIAVLDSEVEARLISAILLEEGIPHLLLSYRDTAYDGIFMLQKGWGVLRGPESEKQKVEDILADIRKGGIQTEDLPEYSDEDPEGESED
ncbi:MAG: hypothetical protein AB1921_19710 [Thermodesulfobacteriota bacterium]